MNELVTSGRVTRNTELSSVEMIVVIAERREQYQNSAIQKCFFRQLNKQDLKKGSMGLVRNSKGICNSSGICSGMRGWSTIYSVLTAALLSLIGGFTLGYSSPTLIELANLEDPELRFGNTLSDVFGASTFVGSLFGAFLAGYVTDKLGRKTSMALNTVPHFVGYFLMMLTYLIMKPVIFKSLLIMGRAISGVGVGWTYVAVPIYVSEISPTKLRGFFVTLLETSLTLGVLLVLALGAIPNLKYYYIALVPMVIVAFFVLIFLWIPETPRWLLLNFHDGDRARSALRYLSSPIDETEITKSLQGIKAGAISKTLSTAQALRHLFCERNVFIPFAVSVVVLFLHQLCGIGITTSYTAQIFYRAGDSNPNLTAFLASGLILPLTTIPCAFLVELVGRKVLLVISMVGMTLACLCLGSHYYLTRSSACFNSTVAEVQNTVEESARCNPHLLPLSILSVVVFNISFELGLGPVSLLLASEYIPVQVKGQAGGIIMAMNRIAGIIVSGTYLNFSEWAGDWTYWWTLAVFNFIGLLLIIVLVIETKGKNLEEIPELFRKKFNCCWKV